MDNMNAETRCPQAFKIALIINRIFDKGIPLPTDQRFHHSTFTVFARIPSEVIQYLSLNYGIRGTQDSKNSTSHWSSTVVNSNLNSEEFRRVTEEARGIFKPDDVPKDARPILYKGTVQIPNSSSNSIKGPQIEEIGN